MILQSWPRVFPVHKVRECQSCHIMMVVRGVKTLIQAQIRGVEGAFFIVHQ